MSGITRLSPFFPGQSFFPKETNGTNTDEAGSSRSEGVSLSTALVLPKDHTNILPKNLAKEKELHLTFRYTFDTVKKIYKRLDASEISNIFMNLLENTFSFDYDIQQYIDASYNKNVTLFSSTSSGAPEVFPLHCLRVFLSNIQEFRETLKESGQSVEEYIERNSLLKTFLEEIKPLLQKDQKCPEATPSTLTEIVDCVFPKSLLDGDGSRFRCMFEIADALDSIELIFRGSYEPDDEDEEDGPIEEYEEPFVFHSYAVQELTKVSLQARKIGGDHLIFQMLQPWCELFVASTTKEDLVERLGDFFRKNYKMEPVDEDILFQRGWMFNRYIASVLSTREFWYANSQQQEMVLYNTLLYVTKNPDCLSKECFKCGKYIKIQHYLLQELMDKVGSKKRRASDIDASATGRRTLSPGMVPIADSQPFVEKKSGEGVLVCKAR